MGSTQDNEREEERKKPSFQNGIADIYIVGDADTRRFQMSTDRLIKTSSIKELNIEGGLSDVAAKELAKALEVNRSVGKFSFLVGEISSVSDTAVQSIIKALGSKSLSSLGFSNKELSDATLKSIAECFKNNPELKQLDLASDNISDVSVQFIADILKTHPGLTTLGLYKNNISDAGLQSIIEALKTNTSLQSLDVAGNRISSVGATELAEVLKTNHLLTKIDLSSNKIGNNGVHALAEALKVNTSLTELNLLKNPISADALEELAKALENNYTLTSLKITSFEKTNPQFNAQFNAITKIESLLARNKLHEVFQETYKKLDSYTSLSGEGHEERHEEFKGIKEALANLKMYGGVKIEARDMILDFYNRFSESIGKQEISAMLEQDFFKMLLSMPNNSPIRPSVLIVLLDCLHQSSQEGLKEKYEKMILAELNTIPKEHPDYNEAQFALANYYVSSKLISDHPALSDMLSYLIHAEKSNHGSIEGVYSSLISYFESKNENKIFSSNTLEEKESFKTFRLLILLACENETLLPALKTVVEAHNLEGLSKFLSEICLSKSSVMPILHLLVDAEMKQNHKLDKEEYSSLTSYSISNHGSVDNLSKEDLSKIFEILIPLISNIQSYSDREKMIKFIGDTVINHPERLLSSFIIILDDMEFKKNGGRILNLSDSHLQVLADLMMASQPSSSIQESIVKQAAGNSEERPGLNRGEVISLIKDVMEKFNKGEIRSSGFVEKMTDSIKNKDPHVLQELLETLQRPSSPAPTSPAP